MTNLIERLRAGTGGGKHWMDLHEEAADEIENLRAALKKPLTEAQIEECVDAAFRKFRSRPQGPCGQQITAYDDWKHWVAREIEHAHGIVD